MTGYKNKEVEDAVNNYIRDFNFNKDKIKLIYNSEFEKGMFSSLQVGMREISDCDWLLYHFVDQPHLPKIFYQEFINQTDNNFNWIQPKSNQIKGHPILINKSLFPNILDSNLATLKAISHSSEIIKKIWNCTYPQVVEDIDTQEDYQKLT